MNEHGFLPLALDALGSLALAPERTLAVASSRFAPGKVACGPHRRHCTDATSGQRFFFASKGLGRREAILVPSPRSFSLPLSTPAKTPAAPSGRPPSSADSDNSGTPLADRHRRDLSSTPSPCSSPELRHGGTAVSSHPRGSAATTGKDKPPVPPRNSSVSNSGDVLDGGSVKSKIQMFQQGQASGIPPPPSHVGAAVPTTKGGVHSGRVPSFDSGRWT